MHDMPGAKSSTRPVQTMKGVEVNKSAEERLEQNENINFSYK